MYPSLITHHACNIHKFKLASIKGRMSTTTSLTPWSCLQEPIRLTVAPPLIVSETLPKANPSQRNRRTGVSTCSAILGSGKTKSERRRLHKSTSPEHCHSLTSGELQYFLHTPTKNITGITLQHPNHMTLSYSCTMNDQSGERVCPYLVAGAIRALAVKGAVRC
jgi:hypothetical protein